MTIGKLVLLAALLALPVGAIAGEPSEAYPLGVCAVRGVDLEGKDAVTYEHKGRQFKFCCQGCLKKFKGDPATYIEGVNKKIIAAQKASYPLTTCVVSGEPHESGRDEVHNNRLVRFCCKMCVKKFVKSPKSFFEKLDKAIIEKQSKDYPLTNCPVSGEPLGSMGKPIDMIVGNTLVKLCCKGCAKKLVKNAATMIKMVSTARSKQNIPGKKAS